MDGFNLLHLRRSKPVSIFVAVVVISKSESIVKTPIEIIFRCGKINNDIKGQCPAQFFIEQRHALINFSALPKIVNEAIFNTDLRESDTTNDHYTEIDVQNLIV